MEERPCPPTQTIEAAIRDKLTRGELRSETPETIWGGKGTGRLCTACGWPIPRDDFEYEIDYPRATAAMRFDQACLLIWEENRRDFLPKLDVA